MDSPFVLLSRIDEIWRHGQGDAVGVLEKIAHVVGLPSPRPLHEQIQSMRPAQLDPVMAQLSATTGRIGDRFTALDEGYYQRLFAPDDASWRGDAAQAFQEHYANLTTAVGRPQSAMAGTATTLRTLQQSIQSVQKQEQQHGTGRYGRSLSRACSSPWPSRR
jgi:hypothetical protein